MMKFFRKYNKQLLAVFMALLMIVFVGGSALENLLTPDRNEVVASTRLGSISYLDQMSAKYTTDLLFSIGLNWRRPSVGSTKELDIIDWILLQREMEALGASTTAKAVRNSFANPKIFEGLDELARRIRVRPNRILEAVAEFQTVQNMSRSVAGAAVPSTAAIKKSARDGLAKVMINAVLIPANPFVDEEVDFTDDELDELYVEYREDRPGVGLTFGYYVDPAVNVQYIKVDPDKIAEQVKVANLERRARDYYDQNRETNFLFQRSSPPEEGPKPEDDSPYLSWEDASAVAIKIVREQAADERAGQIADWLVQKLGEPWFDLQYSKDGYKTAPEQVASLGYYDEVVSSIPATIGFEGSVTVKTTGFFDAENARQVSGFRSARARTARGAGYARDMPFRTKLLEPEIPQKERSFTSEYLATYQTSPYSLHDPAGNVYLFRVIDARLGHVPDSLYEVRDRVEKDLRLHRAYEEAKSAGEGLLAAALEMSLEDAYASDETLFLALDRTGGEEIALYSPDPFPRVQKWLAQQGKTGKLTLIPSGVGQVPTEIVGQMFALEQSSEKTAFFELNDRATVMVVEWVETKRGREDEFDAMKQQIVNQMGSRVARDALSDWLDPEKIRQRNGFELVR